MGWGELTFLSPNMTVQRHVGAPAATVFAGAAADASVPSAAADWSSFLEQEVRQGGVWWVERW